MPNHYHIIVKQNVDRGIHSFSVKCYQWIHQMPKNTKRERVGPLYQGPFKAVYIETDEQLLHLSRYVHINPTVSNVVTLNALSSYPWSSFPDYLDNSAKSFINTSKILSHFKTNQEYKDFVYDHVSCAEQLEKIKDLAMEEVLKLTYPSGWFIRWLIRLGYFLKIFSCKNRVEIRRMILIKTSVWRGRYDPPHILRSQP